LLKLSNPITWFVLSIYFVKKLKDVYRAAVSQQLSEWETQGESLLALVILLDQFPRILHPNSPLAYRYDSLARAVITRAVDAGVRHLRQWISSYDL
jgi:uncharacterized protein (DUF924 family)